VGAFLLDARAASSFHRLIDGTRTNVQVSQTGSALRDAVAVWRFIGRIAGSRGERR
jgi:hypothetical protein